MATITPVITVFENAKFSRQLIQVTWNAVTEADTCAPVECGDFADRSVQIAGTFGAATVTFQGSNDDTTYSILTDPQGNNISKTSAGLEEITEVTAYAKPVATGGTSQSLKIVMVGRRIR
jgi:type IV secretory pathway TrbL component